MAHEWLKDTLPKEIEPAICGDPGGSIMDSERNFRAASQIEPNRLKAFNCSHSQISSSMAEWLSDTTVNVSIYRKRGSR